MPLQNKAQSRAGMAFSRRPSMAGPTPRSTVGSFFDGLQDNLTLGGGDQLKAVVGALYDAYKGKPGMAAYWRRINAEHQQDRLDLERHPTARNWGKGAGTALQFIASGPLGSAVRGGARMAEATPAALRELRALTGAGAVGGVATRATMDRLNHRQSTLAGLAASGIGGALDALLLRGGRPGQAGAVSSAATSVAEDAFDGRVPSAQRAFEAAGQGSLLGAGAGAVGRKFANDLPSNATQAFLSKENLGEWGSILRTLARGDRTISRAKIREFLPDGGFTRPDQRTLLDELVEAKFGWKARLSRRQKQAHQSFGSRYRVDHWLPDDVGSLFAYPTVQLDYDLRDDSNPMRRPTR